ncbi:MAG: hypothetical protein GF355_04275 [Candidatus Eisenbacteria bacterium]|nr:hypothetical protein [Candidatus Eisenbacteria bacterium]
MGRGDAHPRDAGMGASRRPGALHRSGCARVPEGRYLGREAVMSAEQKKKGKKARSKPAARGRRLGWIAVAVLIVVGLGGTFLLFSERERGPERDGLSAVSDATEAPVLRPIRLYFGRPTESELEAEVRWVEPIKGTPEQVAQIVGELIAGSRAARVAPIPPEATVLNVFLDGLGGAYVDFSGSLRGLHPAGASMEWLTVRCVVASITQNVPEVTRVWILVDGDQERALVRTVPLDRYYTWADVRP